MFTFKSDASGEIGYGFYCGDMERTYVWSDSERARLIAWKELFPAVLAAREFGNLGRNALVCFGIDNTLVVYMLNSGLSRDPLCNALMRELAGSMRKYEFDIVASWTPQGFNDHADFLSRDQVGWTARGAHARALSLRSSRSMLLFPS